MKDKPGVRHQPALDRRRLVRGAVVENQVDVELCRHLALERDQELLELERPVAGVQRPDHLPGRDVQRAVQARDPRALVVVSSALGTCPAAWAGSPRSDPPPGSDSLIDAQHHRALGRLQIQAHHVTDLVYEVRILGELPRLLAMRRQSERAPDPRDRRLREPDLGRHRPRRPLRRVLRRRLQRLDDHLLHLGIGDRPRPPRTRLVQQAVQPILTEPRAPLPHRRVIDRQPLRDLRVLQPLGRRQHNPGTQRQRLSTLSSPAGAHDSNCSRSVSLRTTSTAVGPGIQQVQIQLQTHY